MDPITDSILCRTDRYSRDMRRSVARASCQYSKTQDPQDGEQCNYEGSIGVCQLRSKRRDGFQVEIGR